MLRITCPCCGADGEETEFTRLGEAHIRRPESGSASDVEWTRYLHERTNTAGPAVEVWRHAHGCGKCFHLARDTVTQEIYGSYSASETTTPAAIRARMTKSA